MEQIISQTSKVLNIVVWGCLSFLFNNMMQDYKTSIQGFKYRGMGLSQFSMEQDIPPTNT